MRIDGEKEGRMAIVLLGERKPKFKGKAKRVLFVYEDEDIQWRDHLNGRLESNGNDDLL